MGSADLLEAFGVKLLAGRDFTPDEYLDFKAAQEDNAHVPSVIITRGLAERWFPNQSPLGKPFYVTGKQPQIIVGVIDLLARPNKTKAAEAGYAVVLPINAAYNVGGNYVMRVDPARRGEVLSQVTATLNRVDPNRIILDRQTFDEMRDKYFKADRAMAYLLVGVSLALLVITALGVVGLASFWVQQRTRQIGVRRALGATRGDILRYFQLENFILATVGIVLGMALAYAINLWLMQKYQVPRLPAAFLPGGAGLLWLLGQIAVLGPALRAAMIPPAIATRTV
jgi:putative ABC transport system permease protein